MDVPAASPARSLSMAPATPVPSAAPPLEPLELYAAALGGAGGVVVRDERGLVVPFPVEAWLGPATDADQRVLERTEGPVLDVGCGPGRHVHALARRGVLALGVDVSPVAVEIARARGAAAVVGSIFERVPGAGDWASALLLDGNVGIGGRPEALLDRVGQLLLPGGLVIVELGAPGTGSGASRVRLEHGERVGGWFAWATVAVDEVDDPAAGAGFGVEDRWQDDGRWFALLREQRRGRPVA
jgi:SAM-dependent methyltransferase